MYRARYLIRFDDICPTMNWDIWDRIEAVLLDAGVHPILAVVPNNHDPNLVAMPPRADFWSRVRKWQAMGWTIALHGYEHVYETSDSGLIGLNPRSEFAGLSREIQRTKLLKALEIFKAQGVSADAWVAPGHSFDRTTVDLLVELGVDVISDGYFHRPVSLYGAKWVPQQLWRFRKLPGGLWTVCYHANHFSTRDIDHLAGALNEYRGQITSLREVLGSVHISALSLMDRLFDAFWCWAVRTKRGLKW